MPPAVMRRVVMETVMVRAAAAVDASLSTRMTDAVEKGLVKTGEQ